MKSKLVLGLLICCSFAARLHAAVNAVQDELNSRYRNQILALKYPFVADTQEYDATGTPINPGVEGSWTIYGRVKIKKVKLDNHKLVIEGVRQAYRMVGTKLAPGDLDRNARLTLRFASPVSSLADAEGVMRHAFDFSTEEIVQSASEYWREYLAEGRAVDAVNLKAPPGVEKIGAGATAPRAIFTPQPGFNEIARKARFQGTAMYSIVVDATGKVSFISILRPLGLGLDEESVEKMKTWKFEPGKKKGTPVPVVMMIQVAFNLYSGREKKP